MKPSLSVVIPVLNEVKNISKAVEEVLHALHDCAIEQYEIIIVDNGSKDGTREAIEEMSHKDSHIRYIYPKENLGSGQAVRDGVATATYEYSAYVVGDNEMTAEALHNLFSALGKADVINTYISNPEVRPIPRRILSANFGQLMRLFFGVPLRYFTGPAIIRTDLFRTARRSTYGFAFMAEILVQIVKVGYSYLEVPMPLQPRVYGKAGVYRPKDMWRVFKAIFSMFCNIHFSENVMRQVINEGKLIKRGETKISSWIGTPFSYSEFITPKNTKEIKEIVERAKLEGKKIIARGAGSSYGDEALNQNNIVLNMREMKSVISWDKEGGVLKAEPGLMYNEVLPITLKDGWTLSVIPGTRYVTLGGALANNVHGKNSFNRGNFGETVLEFKIVVGSGKEITCSRKENQDLFFGAIGGAGLLGIVSEITLQLIKIPSPYLSVKKSTAPSIRKVIDELYRVKDNEFAIAQIDCFPDSSELGRGTIHTANFVTVDFDYRERIEVFSIISKRMFRIIPKKWLVIMGKYFLNDLTMRLVSSFKYHLDKVTSSNRPSIQNLFSFMFLLDKLPGWKRVFKNGFFEYEPLIPKSKAKEIIPKLISLTHRYNMPAYLSAIKIHKNDDFLISYALDGYSFAMDIPFRPKEEGKQKELLRKMNEIVIGAGGIVYLAKDAHLTAREFRQMYKIDEFLVLKKKYDPDEIFESDMYRRIFK